MNIFFEPVNVNQWDIFSEVKEIGHIEEFVATKSMSVGDIVLLYVSHHTDKENGVYAFGIITKNPYVYLGDKRNSHCYNKLTVDVEIVRFDFNNPMIAFDDCKTIFKQFRSVHRVSDEKYDAILDKLNR